MLFEKQIYKNIKHHVAYINSHCKNDYCGQFFCRDLINNHLPHEYKLSSEEEISFLLEILSAFREDIVNKFFYDKLKLDSFFADLSDESYLFVYLYSFFDNYAEMFCGLKGKWLFDEKTKRNYESDGLKMCETISSLTNYGVTFYKIRYAVSLYCEKEKLLKQNDSHEIKEILDKNEYKIISFR